MILHLAIKNYLYRKEDWNQQFLIEKNRLSIFQKKKKIWLSSDFLFSKVQLIHNQHKVIDFTEIDLEPVAETSAQEDQEKYLNTPSFWYQKEKESIPQYPHKGFSTYFPELD